MYDSENEHFKLRKSNEIKRKRKTTAMDIFGKREKEEKSNKGKRAKVGKYG
jgi:hypothetical protein